MTVYEWITIGAIVVVQTGGAVKWAYSEFVPRKQLDEIKNNIKDMAKKDVEILTLKIDNLSIQILELKRILEEKVQWKS